MAKEIERKFLVTCDLAFLDNFPRQEIEQGYLHDSGMTTRVRIVDGLTAFLTLKGPSDGVSRDEFEYPIPLSDAQQLMRYCGDHKLFKTRFFVPFDKKTWEVDVYHGPLSGLITAELELTSVNESFKRPAWLGVDVSTDKRFSNKNLSRKKRIPALPA